VYHRDFFSPFARRFLFSASHEFSVYTQTYTHTHTHTHARARARARVYMYICIYVYIFFSNVSRGHVEYFWRIDNERPREERLSRKLARNAVDWREFVGMKSSNLSLDVQRIYNRRITVLLSCAEHYVYKHEKSIVSNRTIDVN